MSMCREAIPLACRFRQREVLPEGTGIAQVIDLQFLMGDEGRWKTTRKSRVMTIVSKKIYGSLEGFSFWELFSVRFYSCGEKPEERPHP